LRIDQDFGIIGRAIAFVIGQAASRLVTAFINDIIDPIIGFYLPAGSLEVVGFKVTNLPGTTTEFKYGDLISNIIDFVIIALLVFLAYKQLAKHGFVEDKTRPATEEKK
jgi:large conductance mechanosensitive channel